VRAGVRLGVLEGVAVAVRGLAAGTMGRAVKVRVGIGVGLGAGLATVGETLDTAGGAGLIQQPARALEMMTRKRNRANRRFLASNRGRCETGLSCLIDGRDGILIILSS
jgi:hypothetical protein